MSAPIWEPQRGRRTFFIDPVQLIVAALLILGLLDVIALSLPFLAVMLLLSMGSFKITWEG